jgi:hypothetical protein
MPEIVRFSRSQNVAMRFYLMLVVKREAPGRVGSTALEHGSRACGFRFCWGELTEAVRWCCFLGSISYPVARLGNQTSKQTPT